MDTNNIFSLDKFKLENDTYVTDVTTLNAFFFAASGLYINFGDHRKFFEFDLTGYNDDGEVTCWIFVEENGNYRAKIWNK